MNNENEDKGTGITSQSYMQEQHEAQMESWLDFVWDNKDSATYSVSKSTFLKISKAMGGRGYSANKALEFRRNGESIYLKRREITNTDDISYRLLMQRHYIRLIPRGRYSAQRLEEGGRVPVYPYYYVPLLWENWRKEYREKNNYKQGFHLNKGEAIQELKLMADFFEDQYKRDEREKREREKSETKKEKRRKYYEENREDILAYQRKYREENREKLNARQRKHYAENREKRRAYQRRYMRKFRKENPEKVRARERKYREENSEKVRARERKYYEKNREKVKARRRKYYVENRDENREKINARQRKYYAENREKIAASQRKYRDKKKEE